jgi:hypothetical protein
MLSIIGFQERYWFESLSLGLAFQIPDVRFLNRVNNVLSVAGPPVGPFIGIGAND